MQFISVLGFGSGSATLAKISTLIVTDINVQWLISYFRKKDWWSFGYIIQVQVSVVVISFTIFISKPISIRRRGPPHEKSIIDKLREFEWLSWHEITNHFRSGDAQTQVFIYNKIFLYDRRSYQFSQKSPKILLKRITIFKILMFDFC